jgi:hypothetical protein
MGWLSSAKKRRLWASIFPFPVESLYFPQNTTCQIPINTVTNIDFLHLSAGTWTHSFIQDSFSKHHVPLIPRKYETLVPKDKPTCLMRRKKHWTWGQTE